MPAAVRHIIGVERFGDVLKRKKRLGDMLEQVVDAHHEHQFLRVTNGTTRLAMVDTLERRRDDEMLFRLPGCLVPVDLNKFDRLLRKLPYSFEPAMFGPRFDDEVAMLLRRADAIALLKMKDPKERRIFFGQLVKSSIQIDNSIGLVDLRELESFLTYMIGATEARHFNSATVEGAVFRKSSADRAKMWAEYKFFHVVPEQMKRFLLPTFDFGEEGGRASYSMERMSVPDAALQLVHHSFDPASFDRLLDRFFDFIAARATKHVGVDAVRQRARTDILGKVERRLDDFMKTEIGSRVDALLAVSGPRGGLARMWERTRTLIELAIAADHSEALAVSHGDPCLSNILFNREIGLMRFIDPRGASSLDDAYMHPLYDLAKFSHSVVGGYDFINNGLFECRLDDRLMLALELDNGGPPPWMRTAFAERVAHAGYDLRTIRAYELSLFMSMLPLHTDSPRKLPGFCIVAAGIMTELEGRS